MEKCRSTYQRGGHFFYGAGTSRGASLFSGETGQGREQTQAGHCTCCVPFSCGR